MFETLTTRPKCRVFPGRPDQVAHARDFVRRTLSPCPVLDEAVLLVSELTTNALDHTATGDGGSFRVIVYQGTKCLLIAVKDDGSVNSPARCPEDPLAEFGRGLRLVDVVADVWGCNGTYRGRVVWFELRWESL